MKIVKTDGASWAGKTLVLPGGSSMGFTSELAIDALITHSNATRCGFLQSEIFYPVALPNCFGTGGVTTGCEFYKAGDVIILQLRAPYATASGKQELAAFLVALKEEEQLKDMMCIATVSTHLRTDDDLRSPQVLRVVNFTESENEDHIPELREPHMCLQYGGGVAGPLAEHGVKILAIYAMDVVEIATAETLTAAAKKCLIRSSPELCQFVQKAVQSWTLRLQHPPPPRAIY